MSYSLDVTHGELSISVSDIEDAYLLVLSNWVVDVVSR